MGKGLYGARKAVFNTGKNLAKNALKTGSAVVKNTGKTLIKVGKTAVKTAGALVQNNAKMVVQGGKIATKTIGSVGKSLYNGDIIGASKTLIKGSK